jgi:hypothetical protein
VGSPAIAVTPLASGTQWGQPTAREPTTASNRAWTNPIAVVGVVGKDDRRVDCGACRHATFATAALSAVAGLGGATVLLPCSLQSLASATR